MNGAVIVAGGVGRRMGLAHNKVFAPLCGKPILAHSIQNFESCADISRIVVVAGNESDGTAAHDGALVRELVARASWRKVAAVVAGGATRMQSVEAGLVALQAEDEDVVLVQDGARPFTSPELISHVISAAECHGASISGAAPYDTIQRLDPEGFAVECFDRDTLCAVHTPVAARWRLLRAARERAKREGYLDTPGFEDAALLERNGVRVKLVQSAEPNVKITTEVDLQLATLLMERREAA